MVICALFVKQSLQLMKEKHPLYFFSLKKVFSGNGTNPRELPRSCVISTKFIRNLTEIHFCMSVPSENRYIFAKLLPITSPGRLLLMIK